MPLWDLATPAQDFQLISTLGNPAPLSWKLRHFWKYQIIILRVLTYACPKARPVPSILSSSYKSCRLSSRQRVMRATLQVGPATRTRTLRTQTVRVPLLIIRSHGCACMHGPWLSQAGDPGSPDHARPPISRLAERAELYVGLCPFRRRPRGGAPIDAPWSSL